MATSDEHAQDEAGVKCSCVFGPGDGDYLSRLCPQHAAPSPDEREALDLDALTAIAKATWPKFWQRSFYAPARTMKYDRDEARRADAYEKQRVIRGPGLVGDPGCNPVMVFEHVEPEVLAFVAAFTPQTVLQLLDEIARLRVVGRDAE